MHYRVLMSREVRTYYTVESKYIMHGEMFTLLFCKKLQCVLFKELSF